MKSCFEAPPGWLLLGLDFNALEARVDALVTKDQAKLDVYIYGYDSHSYNTYGYWADKMPDIRKVDMNQGIKTYRAESKGSSVFLVQDELDKAPEGSTLIEIPNSEFNLHSINSIQDKYKHLRQASKTCTFALQYAGSWVTISKSGGFSQKDARAIVANYHKLYATSVKVTADTLKEATRTGYVTCAFGLRVRTPLLKQVILNTKTTPKEASQEMRTAGNALSQSWCLLNNRSQMAFMRKVRKSPYRLQIRPCGTIHDAQYYMVQEDISIVKWVNDNLIPEVAWQDHPVIAHDQVKLSGSLDIFWPTWANPITLSHGASEEDIASTVETALAQRKK